MTISSQSQNGGISEKNKGFEYAILLSLFLAVFLLNLHYIVWDVIVHYGDQLSMRVLAKEFFSTKFFRPQIVYYYLDWRPLTHPDDNYPFLPIFIWASLIKLTNVENSFLVFNSFIYAAQVFLWRKLSLLVTGRAWAGYLTFLFLSVSYDNISIVTTGLKEPTFFFCLLTFTILFLQAKTKWQFAGAGAALSFAYLSRYNALTLLFVTPLFIFFPWEKRDFGARTKFAFFYCLAALLVILPWLLRNFIDFGHPFEYLVTKYPLTWAREMPHDYFWDYPPTMGNLISHMGLKKVLHLMFGEALNNFLSYIDLYFPFLILAVAGVLAASRKNVLIATRKQFYFIFLLAAALFPSVLVYVQVRYSIMSMFFFTFLAFASISMRKSIFRVHEVFLINFLICVWSVVAAERSPNNILPVYFSFICLGGFGLRFLLLRLNALRTIEFKTSRRAVIALAICGLLSAIIPNIRDTFFEVENDMHHPETFQDFDQMGREFKSLARQGDVAMSAYAVLPYYYAGLPTVSFPTFDLRPETRLDILSKLNRIIETYGVTLICDFGEIDAVALIRDQLQLVGQISSLRPNTPPFSFYRVIKK